MLRSLLFSVFLLACTLGARDTRARRQELQQQIDALLKGKKARVGIAVQAIETNDSFYFNAGQRFTLMSVVKFPQALFVLHSAERRQFSLSDSVSFEAMDHHSGYSPLQDGHPQDNFRLPFREVLRYAVSRSDNWACDRLFDQVGGPGELTAYLHGIGARDIGVATTYRKLNGDSAFINWCEPVTMARLLRRFYRGELLTDANRQLLLEIMLRSENDRRRIVAGLPEGTRVAHKTGTSDTRKGVMAAFNDVAIVELPNGLHYAIVVFISESHETADTNARIIAGISRAVWDHFTHQSLSPMIGEVNDLLNGASGKPFNGSVLIACGGKPVYERASGSSDLVHKVPYSFTDETMIGSISKQITAVLVLQQYEQGHLQLDVPIRKYLPELQQAWADSVTIHHLLSHTHGIPGDSGPVLHFRPGTRFEYGPTGYMLLSSIVERVSGKTFEALSGDLFRDCGMMHTFHPSSFHGNNLGESYILIANGPVVEDSNRIAEIPQMAAPGGFISTAEDLLLWNNALYGGHLLKPATLKTMLTEQANAVRDHALFGKTYYGYGTTIDRSGGMLQLGLTGYMYRYISMNFYFPQTRTSVIVLSNTVSDTADIKKTFFYHTRILDIVRKYQK